MRGGTVDQTEATRRWLMHKGIIRRNGIIPITFQNAPSQTIALGTTLGTEPRNGGNRSAHAGNLGAAIAGNLHYGNGHYAMIGIYGPGGAHAMAAWIANDVAFFDPNFGEFYFSDKDAFISWFPTFFRRSGYSWPWVGLCEDYETLFYAKKI